MIHYITTKLPNLWGGTNIRNFYLMKAALDAGFEITIHYIAAQAPDSDAIPEVLRPYVVHYGCAVSGDQYGKDLLRLKVPYVEALKRNEMVARKARLAGEIIQFQELDSYLAVEEVVGSWKGRLILDAHNVDFVRLQSELAAGSRWKAMLAWPWLWGYGAAEERALARMDTVLACSEVDAEYFGRKTATENITLIANGVDVDWYEGVRKKEQTICNELVFVGSLDYPANAWGIKRYLDLVHPQVLREHPEVKLVIVGKHPPEWLETYQERFEIEVTGFVDDVRQYLGGGRIGICPVYEGSGTRLKILEYLACGMGVVSTSKGCEGLGVESGDQLFVAEDDRAFAAYVVELLSDETSAAAMGDRGLAYVEKRFDWKVISKALVEVYGEA